MVDGASPRPAIQLYSLRELDEPLPAIVRRVADAGFEGVEFANRLPDADPDAVADALADAGVEPVGAHADLSDLESDDGRLLDLYESVGVERVVVPHVSPGSLLYERRFAETLDRLREVGRRLEERGMRLCYHTPTAHFRPMLPDLPARTVFEGTPVPTGVGNVAAAYATRLGRAVGNDPERLPENVPFRELTRRTRASELPVEVDVGSVVAAGVSPEVVLDYVAGRVPLVHMSDVAPQGRLGLSYDGVEGGDGVVDFQAAAEAARRAGAEWLVYENDDPDDPEATVERGAESVVALARSDETRTAVAND